MPRFHAAVFFRPCFRRWAILRSQDTELFGEPQRQQLPTVRPASPINLHNSFTRSSRVCTHVPLARTRLFCPVRSSALSQRHSRARCCTPVLAALLHFRAFSTHKAVMPCTLSCALNAALACLLHAQSALALCAPLRPQLHSRACCTHRLSCLVRFLANAC